MLSLSVDIWRPVVSGASQSLTAQVQALFAAGRVGGMWDMGDTSTLFQDTAGATPVTAVTQPIGRVNDKSGLGNHATQPTAAARPIYSARKNLSTKTEKMEDAVWNLKSAVTITADTTVAPDGMTTADSLDFTTTGAYFYQSIDLGVPLLGKQYTYSIWLWSPTKSNIGLRASNDNTGGDQVNQVVSLTSTPQRVSVTRTFTGALNSLSIGLDNRSGVVAGVTGTGVVYAWGAQLELGASATTYQRVNTASDYDTVGFPAFAQFDATDDALLFPAITFGGAFNTFVAGKVTGGTRGIHLWRTADSGGGYWGAYQSGSATSPTGGTAGSPTYSNNGIAVSPQTREQIYTLINGVDSVLESIGVVLSAETALQFSGYGAGFQFQGNAHRVLMISGTLTAGEKLLCRQWAAEGNGVAVV